MSAVRLLVPVLVLACTPRAPGDEALRPMSPVEQGCPQGMHGVEGAGDLRTFCMDIDEVTSGEYAACVRAGACVAPDPSSALCNYEVFGQDRHPINCVSAEHARAYCRWFGRRLPTDAEWLWAARGGARQTAFPWGDKFESYRACVGNDGHAGTCRVDQGQPGDSPQRLRHLVGNVSEWTEAGEVALLRGGDWRDAPTSLETWREHGVSDKSGFRCALTPDDPATDPARIDLALPPSEPLAPTRPLAALEVLAVAPMSRARWTELGDGTFIPFAPEDPTAFGLSGALAPSLLPTELRRCRPLRGLRTTIVFLCDGEQPGARLVAARRDNWAIEWRLPHPGLTPEERVYFGQNTFIVAGFGWDAIAYSLATGKPVWRRDTSPRDPVHFHDPAVYLVGEPQGPAGLVAFDFDTGAELWRMDRYCHVLTGADGLVVDHPRGIYRVDPRTGTIVDTLGSPRERCRRGEANLYPAWTADGRIFAATHEPASGYAIETSYLSSGNLLWRRPLEWPEFVVAHDAVYVWNEGTLLALDPATGDSLAEHTIAPGTRRLYTAGGVFGPLLVQQSDTWVTTLGRVAAPVASETYTVRGRIVPRGAPDDAAVLWLGPHELFPQADGRFTVQGRRSVGTRFELVRSDGEAVMPVLTLDGRRDYDAGELEVLPARP